ncbi:MAG: hypothetical protein HFF62_06515 [Oscillospiraceae bacterium]|nr:hypothetical protein [Oscillospiraceae bacterium]
MPHRLVDALQLGIDAYYDFLQEDPVSKQAFSKARSNLNPEYVRKFADGIAEIHAQTSDAPTYAGMRLIAIDGTDIALGLILSPKAITSGQIRSTCVNIGKTMRR